jgi:RND family efflux transporter MFP subunit
LRRVCLALVVLPLLLAGRHATHSAPPEAQPVATVTTSKPERTTVRRTLELPGAVEPAEQTKVCARVTGVVRKVHADIGDRVKEGQVLADLSVPELEVERKQKQALVVQAEAEIEQARRALQAAEAAGVAAKAGVQAAEAARERAQVDLNRWKTEVQRLEKLTGARVIGQETLDEARHRLDSARASLAEAEANVAVGAAAREGTLAKRDKAQADLKGAEARLEVARLDVQRVDVLLQFTRVSAPFDGVVVRRDVDVGAFVQAGGKAEPLFAVARIDAVRVVADVPEADIPLVGKETPVVIRCPAIRGQEFAGKVARATAVLDPQTRTLRVEIDLPNSEMKLRPGMFARVQVGVERAGVWALPSSAVLMRGEQAFCFRVEDGKAIRTPIQVGLAGDQLIEVLKKQTKPSKPGEKAVWEDFTGAEEIVSTGSGKLKDGQPVRVGPAEEPKKDEPEPGAKDPGDLKTLAKARLEAAGKAYEVALQSLQQTKKTGALIILLAKPEEVYTWSIRWLNAQREASGNKDDRVAALEAHVKRMKDLQQRVTEMVRSGLLSALDASAVGFYRAEADLWLAQERTK